MIEEEKWEEGYKGVGEREASRESENKRRWEEGGERRADREKERQIK